MDCNDYEFVAEGELIDIIPNFSEATIHLITGDIGPFDAGVTTRVPLWVAVYLRQWKRCRIVPPDWLTVASLEALLKRECDADAFAPVPEHMIPAARLLLAHAADDLPDCDAVATLLQDLQDRRSAKLRTSLRHFVAAGAAHARVENLTLCEVGAARPFVVAAVDQLTKLRQVHANAQAGTT